MPQGYCENRVPRGSTPIKSMGTCGLDEIAAAIRQRLEQGITRP